MTYYMRKTILILLILGIYSNAEMQSFVKEYVYQASEADSKISSRTLALEQVKLLLLENLGTYIENEMILSNDNLLRDSIIALTCGIVSVVIVDEKWDGREYYLKAKIEADPTKVIEELNKLRQDRTKVKELMELRKRVSEIIEENKSLRQILKESTDSDKNKIEKRYSENIAALRAQEYTDNGWITFMVDNMTRSTDFSQEIELFSNAIALCPTIGEAYFYRGASYYYHKNGIFIDSAINDFGNAIKYNYQLSESYLYRANSYMRQQLFSKALDDYTRCIIIDSGSVQAYANRYVIYKNNREHEKARIDSLFVVRYLLLDTSDSYVYLSLEPTKERHFTKLASRGIIYNRIDNYTKAVMEFSRVIRLEPRGKSGYELRSDALNKMNKSKEANLDLRTIKRIDLTDSLMRIVDKIYESDKQSDLKKSLAICDMVIKNEPNYSEAYRTKAIALIHMQDYKNSYKYCSLALERDSSDSWSYYTRGFCQNHWGNFSEAIKDYTKAINIDKHPDFYTSRGRSFIGLGNINKAIDDCYKAIGIDTTFSDAYYLRGMCAELQGDKVNQIKYLRIAAQKGKEAAKNYLLKNGETWE